MKITIGDVIVEPELISSILSDQERLKDLAEAKAKGLYRQPFLEGSFEISSPVRLGFSAGLEIEVVNKNNPGMPEDFSFGEDEPVKPNPYPWERQLRPAVIYRTRATVTGGIGWGGRSILGGGVASVRAGLHGGSEVAFSHICIHGKDSVVSDAVRSDLGRGYLFSGTPANLFKLSPDQEYLVTNFESAVSFAADFSWGRVFAANPGFLRTLSPGAREVESLVSLDIGAVGEVKVRAFLRARMEMIASLTEYGGKTFAAIEFRKVSGSEFSVGAGARVSARIENVGSVRNALETLLRGFVAQGLDPVSGWIEMATERIREAREALDISELQEVLGAALQNEAVEVIQGWEERIGTRLVDLIGFKERLVGVENWLERAESAVPGGKSLGETLKAKVSLLSGTSDAFPADKMELDLLSIISGVFPGISGGALAAFLSLPGYVKLLVEKFDEATVYRCDDLRRELLAAIRLRIEEHLTERENRFLTILAKHAGVDPAEVIAVLEGKRLLSDSIAGKGEAWLEGLFDKFDELPLDAALGDVRELVERLAAHLEVPLIRLPERFDRLADQLILALEREAVLTADIEASRERSSGRFLGFLCDWEGKPDGKAELEKIYGELLQGNLDPLLRARSGSKGDSFIPDIDFFAAEELTRRFRLNISLSSVNQGQEGRSTRRQSFRYPNQRDYLLVEEARFWGRQDRKAGSSDWSKGYEVSGGLRLSAATPEYVQEDDKSVESLKFGLEMELRWEGGYLDNKYPNSKFLIYMCRMIDRTGMIEFRVVDRLMSLLAESRSGESVWGSLGVHAEDKAVRRIWGSSPPDNWKKLEVNDVAMVEDYDNAIKELEDFRGPFIKAGGAGGGLAVTALSNRNQYFDDLAELAAIASSGTREQLDKRMRRWRIEFNSTGSIAGKTEKYAIIASLLGALAKDESDWSLTGCLGIRRKDGSTKELWFG